MPATAADNRGSQIDIREHGPLPQLKEGHLLMMGTSAPQLAQDLGMPL